MAEKIDFGFRVPPTHFPPPTLEHVIAIINKKPFPDEKKKRLIEEARKTPSSALRHFLRKLR